MKKAHQLRALNVSYSDSITNKFLDVAIEVAKIRNSNIEFDLCPSVD